MKTLHTIDVCSVFIAYAKGDRLDYAVQKSVELGAHEITLFPSSRCVAAPGDMAKKIARFQRIALETAKQCGRGLVPEVRAEDSLVTVVRQAAGADLPLFFYECEDRQHLKEALEQWSAVCGQRSEDESSGKAFSKALETVSIVTGPEGGFEPHEAQLAQSAGMQAVTLGPRILRCETAPVAALAAVMFHTGNL
jgi:16S rRNA (uracil1498-N3)-methyltransferase